MPQPTSRMRAGGASPSRFRKSRIWRLRARNQKCVLWLSSSIRTSSGSEMSNSGADSGVESKTNRLEGNGGPSDMGSLRPDLLWVRSAGSRPRQPVLLEAQRVLFFRHDLDPAGDHEGGKMRAAVLSDPPAKRVA